MAMSGKELVEALAKTGTGESKLAKLMAVVDGQPDLGKCLDGLEKDGFSEGTIAKARQILADGPAKFLADQVAEAANVAKQLATAKGLNSEAIAAAVAEGVRIALAAQAAQAAEKSAKKIEK